MTTSIDQLGNASIGIIDANQQPAASGPGYSVGNSTILAKTKRTGGEGAYGTALFMHTVEASVSYGSFDVGVTSWLSHEDLQGGEAFGGWVGANSPRSDHAHTYTAGGVIGLEVNIGNRWGDPGYQNYPAEQPRWYTGINVVPDVAPSQDEGPPDGHFPGSFGVNISQSIHGHKWWVGLLMNWNTILGNAFNIFGAGAPGASEPKKIMHLGGYWTDGIDFSGAAFSGHPLIFGAGQITSTASAGIRTLPTKPAGFLKVKVAGASVRVPYYSA